MEEIQRAHRQKYNLFLALLDVDNFKLFNDSFGHQAGDELLKEVADIIQTCIRRNVDIPFRFGGDEFAIILPQITPDQAESIGTRILNSLKERHAEHSGLSIGLAQFTRREGHSLEADIENIITRSDKALYASKYDGRSCLTVAPQ